METKITIRAMCIKSYKGFEKGRVYSLQESPYMRVGIELESWYESEDGETLSLEEFKENFEKIRTIIN